MLRLIFSLIRTTIFVFVVLLLGSTVKWKGKTISHYFQASTDSISKMIHLPATKSLQTSAMTVVTREVQNLKAVAKKKIASRVAASEDDQLSATERMRMRSLIQEVE